MINQFDMKLTERYVTNYRRASKVEKSKILLDYCNLTDISKDTARKRFSRFGQEKSRSEAKRRGAKQKFYRSHFAVIKKCWELSGERCGEILYPVISEYIDMLREAGELKAFNKETISQTKEVSLGTLKNVIESFPKTSSKKHKGNAAIYKNVPIKANFGRCTNFVGYFEVDYVEHSGSNSSGTFAITGDYEDIALHWTARAASLGKSERSLSKIHEIVMKKIFHKVREYNPDNCKGILKILFENMIDPILKSRRYNLSRSRPYEKNDHAHVEKNNDDKVRKLVGYFRYDTEEEVEILNRLYDVEDMISNFFIPTMKLRRKVKDGKGRVIRRVYGKPTTPYQRAMKSKVVPAETKGKLTTIRKALNLVQLRKESDKLLKELESAHGQTILSNKQLKIPVSRT
jgi:hypothetical protein